MPRQTTAPSISITQTDLFHLAVGFGATFLILGLSCGACTLCILRRRRRRRGRGTRSREGPGTSDTDPDTDTDAGLPSLQLWWPPLSSFTHASPDADKEVYWEGPELWEVEVGVGAQDDMEYRDETVWVEPIVMSITPPSLRLECLIRLPDGQLHLGSTTVLDERSRAAE